MSFLSDYQIVSQNNEAPKTFHLYASLVALSSIVSGKVWLDLGLFSIRPNLYVILTGTPGVKKTTAMSITKRLLRELGDIVPLSAECQTKEALTQSMASKTRPCIVGEGMVPKNFAPLDEAKSKFLYSPMTVCVTEFSQFVGTSNAGHMLDFLTTIYDEEIYTSETKGKGVDKLPMPYLTLLGCTVPDWITARLKDDVISGGFSRRAIFVYEGSTNLRIPIPTVTREMDLAWTSLVAKAKTILKLKGPYSWGLSAEDFYCDWYRNLIRPEDPLMEGWFNSIHIQMLKISMLISASEWDGHSQHTVDINHMQFSMELLKIIESNIPKVFKGVGRNELFGIGNKIVELLDRAPDKKLPERFVKKELFRDANLDELTKIINHLIAVRQIRRITGHIFPNSPAENFLQSTK
jgi:hypothetical protein